MNSRNGLYATSVRTLFLAVSLCIAVPSTAMRAQSTTGAKAPATMDELAIDSHGSRMNGFIYVASGSRPHGIVIMLHGFPGNERNLDIAQAARRAGYDVLYFDYRGSWGSGGTFSFANAREDVASAVAWARNPKNVAKYHIDPKRIAVIGHSLGGWLALEAAAADRGIGCVAALAAWNIGYGGGMIKASSDVRKSSLDYFNDVTSAGAPIHTTGAALMNEIESNIKTYDYLNVAPSLTGRSMLLVAATNDSEDEDPAMHEKLEHALRAAGAKHVQNVTYTDDHPFSAHRIELTDTVVRWLQGDCTRGWSAAH